jgi:hydrogenase maturation protease
MPGGISDIMSGETDQKDLLILGLGNCVLGDDRVGLEVARLVYERLPAGTASFSEASVGGIELLHVLEGYQRVVIVDALKPGRLAPGDVQEIPVSELQSCYSPMTPHNAGLFTALDFGRACGLCMPTEVRIFGIGVEDPFSFSEECTPTVADAIPNAVDVIYQAICLQ